MLFWKFCKISKNTFSYRIPPVTASAKSISFILIKEKRYLPKVLNLNILAKYTGLDNHYLRILAKHNFILIYWLEITQWNIWEEWLHFRCFTTTNVKCIFLLTNWNQIVSNWIFYVLLNRPKRKILFASEIFTRTAAFFFNQFNLPFLVRREKFVRINLLVENRLNG